MCLHDCVKEAIIELKRNFEAFLVNNNSINIQEYRATHQATVNWIFCGKFGSMKSEGKFFFLFSIGVEMRKAFNTRHTWRRWCKYLLYCMLDRPSRIGNFFRPILSIFDTTNFSHDFCVAYLLITQQSSSCVYLGIRHSRSSLGRAFTFAQLQKFKTVFGNDFVASCDWFWWSIISQLHTATHISSNALQIKKGSTMGKHAMEIIINHSSHRDIE